MNMLCRKLKTGVLSQFLVDCLTDLIPFADSALSIRPLILSIELQDRLVFSARVPHLLNCRERKW